MTTTPVGYAVMIDNRVFGYGETERAAKNDFERQISGAMEAMRVHMRYRCNLVPLDANGASELAEMLDAPAMAWT